MKLTHQVFLRLPHGGRLWMASATSLKEASEYQRALAASSPGTYLIVDARSRRLVEPMEKDENRIAVWSRRLSAPIRLPRGWPDPLKTWSAFRIRNANAPPEESV